MAFRKTYNPSSGVTGALAFESGLGKLREQQRQEAVQTRLAYDRLGEQQRQFDMGMWDRQQARDDAMQTRAFDWQQRQQMQQSEQTWQSAFEQERANIKTKQQEQALDMASQQKWDQLEQDRQEIQRLVTEQGLDQAQADSAYQQLFRQITGVEWDYEPPPPSFMDTAEWVGRVEPQEGNGLPWGQGEKPGFSGIPFVQDKDGQWMVPRGFTLDMLDRMNGDDGFQAEQAAKQLEMQGKVADQQFKQQDVQIKQQSDMVSAMLKSEADVQNYLTKRRQQLNDVTRTDQNGNKSPIYSPQQVDSIVRAEETSIRRQTGGGASEVLPMPPPGQAVPGKVYQTARGPAVYQGGGMWRGV